MGWIFGVAASVDDVVFMRKMAGIFTDVSLQVFPSSLDIGHKDFVSSGVAVEIVLWLTSSRTSSL